MSNLIKLIEDRKFGKKFCSNYKRLKIENAMIQGVAANSNFLFIADNRSKYLSVFDNEGNFVKFSKPQNVYLKNNYPLSINFSDVSANEENVVASDRHNSSVCRYDREGNLVDIINSHVPAECIEISKEGKIFLAEREGNPPNVYLLSEKESISKGKAINIALDPLGNLYGHNHKIMFKLSDQNLEPFNPVKNDEYIMDIAFSTLYFFVSSRMDRGRYINIFMREKTPMLLDSYELNTGEYHGEKIALVGDSLYAQNGFRKVSKFNILKDDYLLKLENLKGIV